MIVTEERPAPVDEAEIAWGETCCCGTPREPHRHGSSPDGRIEGLSIVRPWSERRQ